MSDTKNISLNVGESKYIIIPLAIVDDVRLTPADKLVYGLVYSLSQKRGYCNMGNNNLTEILPCGERTVKNSISRLTKLGFIKREFIYAKNNNLIIGRKLYPIKIVYCELDLKCSVEKIIRDVQKQREGSDNKCQNIVNTEPPYNNYYININKHKSYDLNEIKKLDTLDFIE